VIEEISTVVVATATMMEAVVTMIVIEKVINGKSQIMALDRNKASKLKNNRVMIGKKMDKLVAHTVMVKENREITTRMKVNKRKRIKKKLQQKRRSTKKSMIKKWPPPSNKTLSNTAEITKLLLKKRWKLQQRNSKAKKPRIRSQNTASTISLEM